MKVSIPKTSKGKKISILVVLLSFAAVGSAIYGVSHALPPGWQVTYMQILCTPAKRASVDPILMPGMADMAHSHDFFGNRNVDENTTTASLLASPDTSCISPADSDALPVLVNRSSYWIPTVYENGNPLPVQMAKIYYRSNMVDHNTTRPAPDGLKMIVGNPNATNYDESSGRFDWKCGAGKRYEGEDGQPLKWDSERVVPTCPEGQTLHFWLYYPECWNGTDLQSTDNISHMAWPSIVEGSARACPAGYVPIPAITMSFVFNTQGGPGVTLGTPNLNPEAPRRYSGSPYSGHGDVFIAWHQNYQESAVTRCLHGNLQCPAVNWKGLIKTYGDQNPATIVTQPANQTAAVGARATFDVTPGGESEWVYRWQKNGVDIPGAIGKSYTTPVLTKEDSGAQYRVVVVNARGNVTSQQATLTVTGNPAGQKPTITAQPSPTTTQHNGKATFQVTATGTNVRYQWYRNGVELKNFANGPVYKTSNIGMRANGDKYTVKVYNDVGGTVSSPAVLTMQGDWYAPDLPNDSGSDPGTGSPAPTATLTASNTTGLVAPASINFSSTVTGTNIQKVDIYLNGNILLTDNTAPYEFTVGGISAGQKAYFVRVTDGEGRTADSSTINVTVSSPGIKQCDFDKNGAVNVQDLSVLITNFGRTVPPNTLGDCSGAGGVPDGRVGVMDLSALLGNYGR